MATRLNGRDGFGTFQRGRIHVSIDIFNLDSFLFRRWETIIVFPPSRGLLSGFNIYAVYVFPNMNMHNLAPWHKSLSGALGDNSTTRDYIVNNWITNLYKLLGKKKRKKESAARTVAGTIASTCAGTVAGTRTIQYMLLFLFLLCVCCCIFFLGNLFNTAKIIII